MDIPEFLHHRLFEIISMETDRSYRQKLWSVVLGLVPKRDGNQWCVLWGENLQEGISGFGDSPTAAMEDFERAMDRRAVAIDEA